MRQQLGFHAENARRLLQGFDYMLHHLKLDRAGIRAARRDEEIAHYALAAFIDEERVPDDTPPLDGGVTRQDLGIHVTQDHVRRTAIVPGKHAPPYFDLFVEQRTQVEVWGSLLSWDYRGSSDMILRYVD